MRCHARCLCLQNTRCAANGSTAPAPDSAAPSAPRRTGCTAVPPIRQSCALPAIGLAVRKTDALPSAASLSVRSKSPLVVVASLFGPLPCAQSTAHCCESLNYLRRESRLAPRAARPTRGFAPVLFDSPEHPKLASGVCPGARCFESLSRRAALALDGSDRPHTQSNNPCTPITS